MLTSTIQEHVDEYNSRTCWRVQFKNMLTSTIQEHVDEYNSKCMSIGPLLKVGMPSLPFNRI